MKKCSKVMLWSIIRQKSTMFQPKIHTKSEEGFDLCECERCDYTQTKKGNCEMCERKNIFIHHNGCCVSCWARHFPMKMLQDWGYDECCDFCDNYSNCVFVLDENNQRLDKSVC